MKLRFTIIKFLILVAMSFTLGCQSSKSRVLASGFESKVQLNYLRFFEQIKVKNALHKFNCENRYTCRYVEFKVLKVSIADQYMNLLSINSCKIAPRDSVYKMNEKNFLEIIEKKNLQGSSCTNLLDSHPVSATEMESLAGFFSDKPFNDTYYDDVTDMALVAGEFVLGGSALVSAILSFETTAVVVPWAYTIIGSMLLLDAVYMSEQRAIHRAKDERLTLPEVGNYIAANSRASNQAKVFFVGTPSRSQKNYAMGNFIKNIERISNYLRSNSSNTIQSYLEKLKK